MNEQLKCIIVDDEPVARNIIRNYCGHLPFIQIAGEFGNALEAKSFLTDHQVDLLFLDIHMPVLSGIRFLSTLKDPPQVIFTTAYQEHAVTAFDLAVCDYLLKPFSLERFIVAVDKAKAKLPPKQSDNPNPSFFVKSDGQLHQVFFRDCLYAEARGNYTKLVTSKAELLTKMPFTAFISQFPDDRFIRVHRSYIIHKDHITSITGNRIFIGRMEIPLAGAYRDELSRVLGLKI